MRTLLAGAVALTVGLLESSSFACGGGFSPGTTIAPAQNILVVEKAGVETYVFAPSACGSAASFGLILPVPAPLNMSPALASPALFTTLNAIAAPTVKTVTECSAEENGGATAPDEDAGAALGGAPTVVSTGQVGFLDWVQMKADSVTSFTDWLTANGYPYSANAESAFNYYVTNGWYFVAFKMGQSAPGYVCDTIGPIQLSFPTTTPVVPARIVVAGASAVDAGPSPETTYYSWNVFTITDGTSELVADGSWGAILAYSGAVSALDANQLSGFASAGDWLTENSVSFASGSVTGDIGFAAITPYAYRGTITQTTTGGCVRAGRIDCDVSSAGSRTAPGVLLVAAVTLGEVLRRRRRRAHNGAASRP